MPKSSVNSIPPGSPAPLSVHNVVTNPPAPPGGSSPNVGTPQTKPKAGEIKYEWEQSVAKLNEEIKELRDATAKLLAEIRALIKDYSNDKELTTLEGAIAAVHPSVSRAYADVEHMNHILKGIKYDSLSEEVAQKVKHFVDEFNFSIGRKHSTQNGEQVRLSKVPESKLDIDPKLIANMSKRPIEEETLVKSNESEIIEGSSDKRKKRNPEKDESSKRSESDKKIYEENESIVEDGDDATSESESDAKTSDNLGVSGSKSVLPKENERDEKLNAVSSNKPKKKNADKEETNNKNDLVRKFDGKQLPKILKEKKESKDDQSSDVTVVSSESFFELSQETMIDKDGNIIDI